MKFLSGEEALLPRAPVKRFSRRSRVLLIAAVFLLAVGTGSYIGVRYHFWRSVHPPSNQLQARRDARPSVAVLGFENLSGQENLNWLGDELTENLGSQLDTDEIHFINSARVEEMKRDLGLQNLGDLLKPGNLQRIHEFLGCDYVVMGSYASEGEAANPTIEWNIHVEKTLDGKSLGTVTQTLAKSNRFKVESDAGRLVREKLGVQPATSEDPSVAAALPTNSEASIYYTEGVVRLRNFDPLNATKLLEQAVNLEPDFAPAHSELAEAWSDLGYEIKAQKEAKKAFDLSPGLSKVAGGLIEARYYEATHDWDRAIAKYFSLWDLFGEPEYGLLLAKTQVNAGKAKEALQTLDQLRKSNPPAGIRAQIDLQAAEAQEGLANFQEQLESAAAAANEAQKLDAKLLLARARISQCLALLNVGHPNQANPICEEALKLNQAAGDHLGMARATNAIANAYFNKGDNAQAEPLYEEALQLARTIGDKLDEAGALTNLGNIKMDRGDFAGAKKAYQASTDAARERGDQSGLALAQQDLAGLLYTQGDRVNAKEMFERSLKLAKEIGAKDTEARALNNLCMLSTEAGQLKTALKTCRDSLQLRQEIGDKIGIARSLCNIGDILLDQGDLAGSRQSYQQALKMQEDLKAKGDAAYTQIALGWLTLQEEHPMDVRREVEDAAAELASEKDMSGEAQARVTLAEAWLSVGNLAEAHTQIVQAAKLAQQVGDRSMKLAAAITNAKIDAQSGRAGQALTALESTRKEARSAGLVEIEYEARLALGEVEIEAGKTVSGQAVLRALAQEAKAKGFDLIARKAAKVI